MSEKKISRKITQEEYEKIRRLYWFASTDKVEDEEWQKPGGRCDQFFVAGDLARMFFSGEKIKTERDLKKLEFALRSYVPEEFDLDDIAEQIQNTRDYIRRSSGRTFPL